MAFFIVVIAIIAAAAVLSTGNTARSITDGVSGAISQMIDGTAGDSPSIDVPAVTEPPAGDQVWIVTEYDLNQRIARREGSFGPVNDVRVELNEGTVSLHFHAYGVNGTYHGSLTARDGVPVVAESRIDGPLGWFVSSGEIDEVLNEEMAAIAAEQRISVESVRVQPGQVVLGITGG
jgi:hypothetical protein